MELTAFIVMYRYRDTVKKGRRYRWMMLLPLMLCLLQLGDLCINGAVIYRYSTCQMETASDYRRKSLETGEAAQKIRSFADADMYRSESLSPRSENDSFRCGYHGITDYNSVTPVATREYLTALGYPDNGMFTRYDQENTETADAVLGIKYLIDGSRVHVSSYALPIAMGTVNDPWTMWRVSDMWEQIFASDNLPDDVRVNPYEMTRRRLRTMIDKSYSDDLFTRVEILNQNYNDGFRKRCRFKVEQSGNLYFWLDELSAKEEQDLSLYLNGKLVGTYGNESNTRLMNLGKYQKGDILSLKLISNEHKNIKGIIDLRSESTEELQKMHDMITPFFCSNVIMKGDRLSFDLCHESRAMVTSVPYDPAWKICVNGIPEIPQKLPHGMIGINVGNSEPGPLHVEMQYQPAGLFAGIIVSVLTGCMVVILGLLQGWKKAMRSETSGSGKLV